MIYHTHFLDVDSDTSGYLNDLENDEPLRVRDFLDVNDRISVSDIREYIKGIDTNKVDYIQEELNSFTGYIGGAGIVCRYADVDELSDKEILNLKIV